MRVASYLEDLAQRAIERAHGSRAPAMVRPADPTHGDYQVNGLMALAKQSGRAPRELAEPVAAALRQDDSIAAAEVAGPGFINLRLDPGFVGRALAEAARDHDRDGVPPVGRPERIVVDYSSPNIAKEMHVGHIRSTILGAALCRMLRFLGHEVLGDNHVGDYGTQFGMLIVGMRRFGSEQALAAAPVQELERVYRLVSEAAKADPALGDEARAELAKLQRGDAENLALWRKFVDATRRELDAVYARLGVHFELWRGESEYEPMLPGVIQLLIERGIAREDQGALCVFFEGDRELGKSPFIVRKKDGAYLYSTTDIATVLYRRDQLKIERALYVVDQRQKLHFRQLFATMQKLGVAMRLEHIGFGSVLGKDGKPLKTRSGELIKLSELLDEAEERAERLIEEEGLEVEPERKRALVKSVGVGAVKYADLSQNRVSDYRFDWDKLISLKGNSGPYLQYAHARVKSIFRRGAVKPEALDAGRQLSLMEPAEAALARRLLRFADVVHEATTEAAPHLICEHLYELARVFNGFFEQCPVLKAADEQRRSRLLLCWLAARQLSRGLGLLGIDAPDRM